MMPNELEVQALARALAHALEHYQPIDPSAALLERVLGVHFLDVHQNDEENSK
jgi:hypothetical protein